ncbi:MAG: DUF4157 domain-containing protein [Deltaproteobacteria bacterium]|nr:DUF4157 domain-containing protein [Deltaproteobacteria bacterium]
MERLFDWNFGDVRIEAEDEGAARTGARAWTHGAAIGFAPGAYAPTRPRGRALLAHELAHHIQQTRRDRAPVATAFAEREADAAAGAVASGRAFEVRTAASGTRPLLKADERTIEATPGGGGLVVWMKDGGAITYLANIRVPGGGTPNRALVNLEFLDTGPSISVPKHYVVTVTKANVHVTYREPPPPGPTLASSNPLAVRDDKLRKDINEREQLVAQRVAFGLSEVEARRALDAELGPAVPTAWEQQRSEQGDLQKLERIYDGEGSTIIGYRLVVHRAVNPGNRRSRFAGTTVTYLDRFGAEAAEEQFDDYGNVIPRGTIQKTDAGGIFSTLLSSASRTTARADREAEVRARMARWTKLGWARVREERAKTRLAWEQLQSDPEKLRSVHLAKHYLTNREELDDAEAMDGLLPASWAVQRKRAEILGASPDKLARMTVAQDVDLSRALDLARGEDEARRWAWKRAGGAAFGTTAGEALAAEYKGNDAATLGRLDERSREIAGGETPLTLTIDDERGTPGGFEGWDFRGDRMPYSIRKLRASVSGQRLDSRTTYLLDPPDHEDLVKGLWDGGLVSHLAREGLRSTGLNPMQAARADNVGQTVAAAAGLVPGGRAAAGSALSRFRGTGAARRQLRPPVPSTRAASRAPKTPKTPKTPNPPGAATGAAKPVTNTTRRWTNVTPRSTVQRSVRHRADQIRDRLKGLARSKSAAKGGRTGRSSRGRADRATSASRTTTTGPIKVARSRQRAIDVPTGMRPRGETAMAGAQGSSGAKAGSSKSSNVRLGKRRVSTKGRQTATSRGSNKAAGPTIRRRSIRRSTPSGSAARASSKRVGAKLASKRAPATKGAPAASKGIPSDLQRDPAGVYGYMPTKDSPFHTSKGWPDWSNPEQVALARKKRIQYLADLAKKKAADKRLIQSMRASGKSDRAIAREIVDRRNLDRIATYDGNEEALKAMYKRNLEKYQRKEGPTLEFFEGAGKSVEQIIQGSTRSNRTVDILTGLEVVK